MSKSDDSSQLEHELSIFRRVRNRIERVPRTEEGYEVYSQTSLSGALDNLASSPVASFIMELYHYDYEIVVKGEDAGTWTNPDISIFQKHATPSPFGRGEETIMDPSYRHGTELSAHCLTFSSEYQYIIRYIQNQLAPAMFVGKMIQLKLYKLAIYNPGGHFDWHRDSTHSDAHHGTVLWALNTEWEGGELMVRQGGVETSVDLHPARLRNLENLRPVIVAFYTDTEHKVMPVTKGVRLVLQFDVEVVGELPPGENTEDSLDEAARRRERLASRFRTYPNVDNTLIQAVVDEIRRLHERGFAVVAFPLAHLYRKASVKKEYLKGNDSTLLNRLESYFDVSVDPILIHFTDDGELGGGQSCIAYKYASSEVKKDDFESEDEYVNESMRDRVFKKASFHLPRASAIEQISSHFVEHVGNEYQKTESRYFGAGMFVTPKGDME